MQPALLCSGRPPAAVRSVKRLSEAFNTARVLLFPEGLVGVHGTGVQMCTENCAVGHRPAAGDHREPSLARLVGGDGFEPPTLSV